MQYLGSKRRIKNDILPIILKDRREGQTFVDLFCGGCNLIDAVASPRLANDLNEYLIALWEALQNGWEPPSEVSENEYNLAKTYRDLLFSKHEIGFIAICCSFGSKWFMGYGRRRAFRYGGNKSLCAKNKSLCAENKTTLLKQIKLLQDVFFTSLPYDQVIIPKNSVVYCDPPYKGVSGYKDKNFDHDKFWNYCRALSEAGHSVFISEYKAPDDYVCVYTKLILSNMQGNNAHRISKSVEKLFVHESQLDI